MLSAMDAAGSLNAPVFLVDDDAYLSLRRMFKEMGLREKLRFLSALIPVPSFRRKTTVEREISRYEENEEAYMEEFARYFPTAKRILIDERNMHMAERIYRIAERYGRVAAVLGDAHLEGIAAILRKRGAEVNVVHMKDYGGPAVRMEIRYRHS